MSSSHPRYHANPDEDPGLANGLEPSRAAAPELPAPLAGTNTGNQGGGAGATISSFDWRPGPRQPAHLLAPSQSSLGPSLPLPFGLGSIDFTWMVEDLDWGGDKGGSSTDDRGAGDRGDSGPGLTSRTSPQPQVLPSFQVPHATVANPTLSTQTCVEMSCSTRGTGFKLPGLGHPKARPAQGKGLATTGSTTTRPAGTSPPPPLFALPQPMPVAGLAGVAWQPNAAPETARHHSTGSEMSSLMADGLWHQHLHVSG